MNTSTLGLIVVAYLLSLACLGFLRYKKATNTNDYLVGERQMNPIVMALSYGAVFIPASAIVGFGEMVAAFGIDTQWSCFLNMPIGVIIVFILSGLRTRRMEAELNVSTFPQLLDCHFRSHNIRVFIAAVIFIGISPYVAVIMKGGAVFIEQIFQADFNVSSLMSTLVIAAYVIVGGMREVMYTDALQEVIMFGCVPFLLFSLYQVLDMNFIEASKELTAIAPLVPKEFEALGHQGRTAILITGSPQWHSLVTSLILGVGIGCLAQPQLVARSMTVRSNKQLNRGVFTGCFFLVTIVGVTYHAGASSDLFLPKTGGTVATEVVQNIDKIAPYFINKAMPDWFVIPFTLCILLTSMSTLSSQSYTMGASVGSDVYGAYKPRSRSKLTNVIRLDVLFFILVSYIICYMLPYDIIAYGTPTFTRICAAVPLPAYFCALYRKKVTKQGVMVGLWVGTIGNLFVLVLLHQKESKALGIREVLFGRDVLIITYSFPVIDPILFTLPLSVLAIIIIGLMAYRKQVLGITPNT